MIHAQIQLTTGRSGSGKSYVCGVVFCLKEWFPEHDGKLWTNLPLNVTKLCEKAVNDDVKNGCEYLDYEERIRIIPEHVKDLWKRGVSGPWEFFADIPEDIYTAENFTPDDAWAGKYFPDDVVLYQNKYGEVVAGIDLDGDYFQIDEAHNYLGTYVSGLGLTQKEHGMYMREWQSFLAEGRHRGFISIEFITQHPKKLNSLVERESGARRNLYNRENELEPIFKIPNKDWFNLYCGLFSATYQSFAILNTYMTDDQDKEKLVDTQQFKFRSEYFKLYNSFSEPERGGKAGGKKLLERPYERFLKMPLIIGKLKLLAWFLKRNGMKILLRPINKTTGLILLLVLIFQVVIPEIGSSKTTKKLTPNQKKQGSSKHKVKNNNSIPIEQQQEKIDHLKSNIDRLIADNARLKTNIKSLTKLVNTASQIVYLSSDKIGYQNGLYYHKGETINHGNHKGEILESIDVKNDVIYFSSGRSVRLSGVREFTNQNQGSYAGIPEHLQQDQFSSSTEQP